MINELTEDTDKKRANWNKTIQNKNDQVSRVRVHEKLPNRNLGDKNSIEGIGSRSNKVRADVTILR